MTRLDGVRSRGRRQREEGTARGRRWFRALLAVLVTAAVVVPLTAAIRPRIPAPAPAALAPATAATLDETYAANRANAALASRMAAAHGDRHRAAADRTLAAPSRRLLAFDGRGAGRATEVFGDLAHADRVAVLVPGSDTSLDTYGRFDAGAQALYKRLTRQTGARTAVIAWLGYTTPGTVSTTVITPARADEAAPGLREFVSELRAVTAPDVRISLLCHSYGSVVCGRAAPGLDVDDLVLLGSPGTGADSAAGLRTRARVWAARGADDWVADVPHASVDLLFTTVGFGVDPVSPSFGARVFAAGDGGHSDYFSPGSVSLTNLARIVLGRTTEVSRA
ncbi:alpha/beta hydrolase family protein [Streptomyces sp. NBC_01275]|uniref:alpha/beta hydrolase n=1 Tax=Streptomyces sp. NBC_01275 TaxID=2903807 RepID=UPI00224CEEA5|nr:alpha/beta hydrolase [Streptomyces sp. NBC_01275]MCX4763742.1 alpha/beta hydrolase family protein [Streptomyces sp. NBC_01275]